MRLTERKKICVNVRVRLTNNYNVDSTWHNKIKLHLNKSGTSHCLNLFQK